MKVIRKGGRRHDCLNELPGMWLRWRLGLKEDAIVECSCGRHWIWFFSADGVYWRPVPK